MRLTLTGTGTSQGVPVLGCGCQVCQSSDSRDNRLRTAALLQSSSTHIAIDAGPDFRQQMLRTNLKRLDAILITHEHNDHIVGLDDVRPFNFMQKRPMDVYGLPRVLSEVRQRFPYVFSDRKYPGAPSINLHGVKASQSFSIGDIAIETLGVSHGALEILGYKFGKMVYLTDANKISKATLEQIGQPEILVLNALHEKPHHSHFNLAQAIEMATKIAASQTYLVHMSHRMGLHARISGSLPEGIELAYDGLQIELS